MVTNTPLYSQENAFKAIVRADNQKSGVRSNLIKKPVKIQILPSLILKNLAKSERRRIYLLLYQRFYHQLPEVRLYMKLYHQVPANKDRARRLRNTPENKAKIKIREQIYSKSEKGRKTKKRWLRKNKRKMKEYKKKRYLAMKEEQNE